MKAGLKIAISGKSGCGNSTVCKLLSQTLGLRLINYTFRNVAAERNTTLEQIRAEAEKDPSWDRYIDEKQVEMASEGNCVLGSRLAIWVLKDADLRVYLKASPEVRAGRIRQRDGGELAAVLAETMDRDRNDSARYLKLYGINNDEYGFVDLVIDTTSRIPEMVLEDIIYALRIKKLM